MRIILNWAASCGGCDVSLLDSELALNVAQSSEVLYWPVALDFKRNDLEAIEDGSVDIGIINGGIRTSEQEEEAKIAREKCKILVAFGSCACFGGIPGLANQYDRESIINRAYDELAVSLIGEKIFPQPSCNVNGLCLTLPEFYDRVKPLDEVVEVDYYVPGCPPSTSTIEEFLATVGNRPEKKYFASDKSLCHECKRNATKSSNRVKDLHRPHEVVAEDVCLLEQGLVCLGFATRGGCGARCINVNMPCRGCYGKLPKMTDSGDAITTIASVAGVGEDYTPPPNIFQVLNAVKDPVGIFYMFSLPKSAFGKYVGEEDV